MAKQAAEYVILCEDRLQAVFVRTYLTARGIDRNRIVTRFAPRGKGSGEQFVRDQYALQVAAHRIAAARRSAVLIVVIDADKATVRNRLSQLDRVLDAGGHRRRADDERIGIFVPKRSIETWIRFAAGKDTDEASSYREFEQNEGESRPHVRRLANVICRAPLPDDAPPSLVTACDEVRRIF
jgi:hypothetical protein